MKYIKTFEEFVNESLNEAKSDIKIPDLPEGKVWRATETFNASDLPWEKYADTWFGKFRKFNIYAEGIRRYPKDRAIVIHKDDDYLVSNCYDSGSIIPKGDKEYLYYSDKKFDLYNDWKKKMIYMALEKGLVKMDSINKEDEVSLKFTEISNAISDKKKLTINGIEVLGWDDIKFDFDRGYLRVNGFGEEGKKEETLIRDLLKAKIEIK